MKRLVFLLLLSISFLFISTSAKIDKSSVVVDSDDTIVVNQPFTDYKVNRYYDEYGNQIGYDSSFTYSYSYSGGGEIPDEVMEIFENFNSNFMMPNYSSFFSPDFNIFSFPYDLNYENETSDNDEILNFFDWYQQQIIEQQKQMKKRQQIIDSLYQEKEQIYKNSNVKTYSL